MTVCMICGHKDCYKHDGYDYPRVLLERLFGVHEDYASELERLQPLVVHDRTREVYGRKFVFQMQGMMLHAECGNERFPVKFADPRLMSRGVRYFYPNGTCIQEVVQTQQQTQPPPVAIPTSRTEIPHVDLIEQFGGRDEGEVHHLIAPERYLNGGQELVVELCEALLAYLPKGDMTHEIERIQAQYKRGKLCYETAVALLVSYFPHAADQGYAIPMAKPNSFLADKTDEGLRRYLMDATYKLYPRRAPQLHQVLREMCSYTGLFAIFLHNVFKKSVDEIKQKYKVILELL